MRRSNLQIIFGILFFFVGAAIIFLIVNDDDDSSPSARSGSDADRVVTVIVAATDIEAGTFGNDLPPEALTTQTIAASEAPANAVTSADALADTQIAANLSEGDIITSSALRTVNVGNFSVPEGREGLAVQLNFVEGGAQFVGAGDRINIFAHYDLCELTERQQELGLQCPPFQTPRSELIVTDVQVLAVSRQTAAATTATTVPGTPSLSRETDAAPIIYFLAVTTEDAERLIFASQQTKLFATLLAPDAGPSAETDGKDSNAFKQRSADSASANG